MPTRATELDTTKLDEIIRNLAESRGVHWVIADGVEHGVYVELGTTRMAARPCLVPAFEKHGIILLKAIGAAIEKMMPLNDLFGKAAFDIQRDYQANVPVDTGALKNSIHVDTE